MRSLVFRGLSYYWRTNVAVVVGVATAVAVLAGALLVGDSVRGSLRDLVLQRLGRADRVVEFVGLLSRGARGRARVGPERRGLPRDCRRGRGDDSDRRSSRVRRPGLWRRRSLLALSRSRHDRTGRTRRARSARRWPPRSARTPARRCSSGSSGHPRFQSSRSTAGRTRAAAPSEPPCARWLPPRRWASSRCARSRARSAPSSCR